MRLFIVYAILLFSSCASVQTLQYKGFENFAVSNITKQPTVKVDVKLYNPAIVGAKLRSAQINLELQDTPVANFNLDKSVRMKRKHDFTLPLTFETSSVSTLTPIIKPGLDALMNGKQIPFTLNGQITIQKFIFFRKTFQFNYKDGVNVKDIKM